MTESLPASRSYTYKNININNCQQGLYIAAGAGTSGGLSVGSITLIDSTFTNVPVGIITGWTPSSSPPTANSLILENVQMNNVGTMVKNNGGTALGGGSSLIAAYGQGHEYVNGGGPQTFSGNIQAVNRPGVLTQGGSRYYERSKPSYAGLGVGSFASVRSGGARGDGNTDDTAALQNTINSATSAGKVVFIDAGLYRVTGTINVPPNAKIVGEAYPLIMASGGFFSNINNPQPVIKVGSNSGQAGQVELSDFIVGTQGNTAGATLFEWNLASTGTPSGMWDVHTRKSYHTSSFPLI